MLCSKREWGGILDGCFSDLFIKLVSGEGSGEGDHSFFFPFFKNAKDGTFNFILFLKKHYFNMVP